MHNPCVRSLGFYRGGVHRRGGQSSKCDSDRAARDHDRPKPHAMLAKLKSAGVVHSFPPQEGPYMVCILAHTYPLSLAMRQQSYYWPYNVSLC